VTVTLESTVDREAWTALLASDPNATVFHSHAWMEAWLDAYPYYRPVWFVAADAAGRLLGALPCLESVRAGLVQRLSLPYGAYATPLVRGEDREERDGVRRLLLDAWWREAGRPRVVRAHLTLFVPPGGESMPEWTGTNHSRFESTHLVDLSPGFERIWSEVYDGDVRTSCRKAERLGVTAAREPEGIEEIESLYRGQASGWPNHTPFPPGFLRAIVTRGGAAADVWLARHEGRAVAGQLVLLQGDLAFSWVAVNRPEGRRLNAPTLLYRTLMEDLSRRGFRSYNFGSSRGVSGVESFKEDLGGRPYPYSSCLREAAWFRPLHRLQYRARGIRGGV